MHKSNQLIDSNRLKNTKNAMYGKIHETIYEKSSLKVVNCKKTINMKPSIGKFKKMIPK